MTLTDTMLSYFIWNGDPEIFSIGFFSLRWYGLLFALGFLISQQLLFYIHKAEGKPERDVETLTIIMIAATIIGARLGHIIFYQPEMLWEQPMAVFVPFEFSSIKFTSLTFKSLLGTLLPVAILVWIYMEFKKKPKADVLGYVVGGLVLLLVAMRFAFRQDIASFFPVELVNFKFTGFEGLASHGGAFAILFALWLYSNYSIRLFKPNVELSETSQQVTKTNKFGLFIDKRIKPGQSYLQVLDRIVILVFLTGALIRLGNYFNSEIIGKPTDSPTGVLFTHRLHERIMHRNDAEPGFITNMAIEPNKGASVSADGRLPVNIYLFFKAGTFQDRVNAFVNYDVKGALNAESEFFAEGMEAINYQVLQQPDGTFGAKIQTTGIVRHPSQLYESISCFLLFAFFWWYWSKHKNNLPEGRIFGWFMVILWGLRFVYEFLKENQVAFEDNLDFNMGQILSIPLFLAGIWVLVRSYKKAAS